MIPYGTVLYRCRRDGSSEAGKKTEAAREMWYTMRYTVSLKENRDFRRLYNKGKTTVNSALAVYVRPNRLSKNRLGLTVGTKVGKAVCRNRVRRLIRESYRLQEDVLKTGYDLVIVARVKAGHMTFWQIDDALKSLFRKLGLYKESAS